MGNLNNLPTEIQLDIITRLPIESILDCKLVCIPWRNLVSHHPSFSRLHLSRLNHSPDACKFSFIFINDKHFYYFEYNENTPPIESIRRINFTLPFRYFGYLIFGSLNGLVCLSEYREDSACICNPVTKEYVKLPRFNRDSEYNQYKYWTRGFGYVPLTGEYKVVEIDRSRTRTEPCNVEVWVYTVGSGNGWRNVGRFDLKSGEPCLNEYGVCANGALQWVNKDGGTVFVFDLTDEKFREHVSPPPKPMGWVWYGYSVGVFGGDLYYDVEYGCSFHESNHDIWVWKKKNDISEIKEQVEQETMGWSKEFSISKSKPFAWTKRGGVLCIEHFRYLGIYDTTTSTSKELGCFSSFRQIFPHKNTLVSLKELGEEDVKIMHPGKLVKDRKPFFPTKEIAT